MEYDLQLIGARLQAARKAKGYTQDYVSARADITEKFLSQIERGKAGLSVQTLIALCDILEITPNYVLLPDAARVLEEPIGPLLKGMSQRQLQDVEEMVRIFVRNCRHEERAGPRAGAETCGERPPGRNEARAGSALAALALRAFCAKSGAAFRRAKRPGAVCPLRGHGFATPHRSFAVPSRLRRAGSPTAKPRRLLAIRLHFACGETRAQVTGPTGAGISALLPGTIVNRPGFLYNKRQDSYHT